MRTVKTQADLETLGRRPEKPAVDPALLEQLRAAISANERVASEAVASLKDAVSSISQAPVYVTVEQPQTTRWKFSMHYDSSGRVREIIATAMEVNT